VHCFGPNGVYARALARITRIPLVVTGHGESFADDHQVFERSPLMGWSLRRAMAEADRVTACSELALDDLRRRFGLHGGVVTGNGVDVDAGVTGLPREDPPVVFAVGRVEHTKGFDLLLRAFADAGLADRARLVIGGDGGDRAALVAEVTRLGLVDAISFPGRLDPTEVAHRMATASVVVVPSRREAFGIVALEAWRAGTPLVATNLGGPVDFVRDGIDGLLVDPRDTDALGRAIVRVLDDRDLGERLSAAGLVKVREFSWDRVVDRYEAVVDEVLR
jgi:glycogen synthase